MSKFDALFEDENDIFGGTPESKYWDMATTISPDFVKEEFDDVVRRIAVMECMLREQIDEELLDREIDRYAQRNKEMIENYKKSVYMELAGKLVFRLES